MRGIPTWAISEQLLDYLLGQTWRSLEELYSAALSCKWTDDERYPAPVVKAVFLKHLSTAIELGNPYTAMHARVASESDPWEGARTDAKAVERYTESLVFSRLLHQYAGDTPGEFHWAILVPVDDWRTHQEPETRKQRIDASQHYSQEKERLYYYPDWNVTLDPPATPYPDNIVALFDSSGEVGSAWEFRTFGSGPTIWDSPTIGTSFDYSDVDAPPPSKHEPFPTVTLLDELEGILGTSANKVFSRKQIDPRVIKLLPALDSLARGIVRGERLDRTRSDDLVQLAVEALLKKGDQFRGHASFRTFALKCAKNAMLDEADRIHRKWSRYPPCSIDFIEHELVEFHPRTGRDPCFEAARYSEVVALLKRQPDAEVLTLAAGGLSDEELAEQLGVSYEAARKRRQRAAKRFISELDAA